MLWFFPRRPYFPQIVFIYRAPKVWALNSRLHCGYPKFWPRLHYLSRPRSFVATEFSIFIVGPCCSMQSSVATCSLCFFLDFVAIVFFSSAYSFCRDRSFFGSLTICLAKSVVLTVLCRGDLMCGSLNSYVATLTNFVATEFLCSFFKLVSRPVFMSRQLFCFGSCCNNVSYTVRIPVVTDFLCRDRFLSPLNLISCCSFILMLRHDLLV